MSDSIWTDDWWVDFVAGWVSGAASVVACQPLDTVLTRFQAGQGIAAAGATATAAPELRLAALGSSVRGLAREYGMISLWRGSSPMIGVVPFQNALLMGGYGFGKQYASKTESNGLVSVFVGGCAGGVLQSFLVSPVEWIKVNQQTQIAATTKNNKDTARSLARTLFRHKGSLWNRGLTATLLRDGIPHGVWFASYEYCKVELLKAGTTRSDPSHDSSSTSSAGYYESVAVPLVSGAFAATAAWAVGYPFDIIKTRIQATTVVGSKVPGVVATAQQLVAEADGNIVRGLYRGFGWKLVRSIPASMIGFLTYEVVAKGLTGN